MRRLFVFLILAGCGGTGSQLPGHDFLGIAYKTSPLGEEQYPDTDPLIRFDAFDCTTFVETVLANGNEEQLNKIRYKNGEVSFVNRNHFIESDWLTNNSERVENISKRYGPTKIRNVVIDKKSWFKKVHNIDTDFSPVKTHIDYIPYEYIDAIKIHTPMIVLFITDNPNFRDKIGTDLAVVHMGFIMPNGILRHASSERGMVVDVSFHKYAEKRKQNKQNIGIALVKIK